MARRPKDPMKACPVPPSPADKDALTAVVADAADQCVGMIGLERYEDEGYPRFTAWRTQMGAGGRLLAGLDWDEDSGWQLSWDASVGHGGHYREALEVSTVDEAVAFLLQGATLVLSESER